MTFRAYCLNDEQRAELARSFNPEARYIAYLTHYSWEDITGHEREWERYVNERYGDGSRAFKQILDDRRRALAGTPNVADLVIRLVTSIAKPSYPQVQDHGFDLVMWFFPKDGVDVWSGLYGWYEVYPRLSANTETEGLLRWGLNSPPIRLWASVHEDDESIFLALLEAGVPDTFKGEILLDDEAGIATARKPWLREVLATAPEGMPLLVGEGSKLNFLHAACNNLLLAYCRQQGIPLPGAVRVSAERIVERESNGETYRVSPNPRIEIVH